MTALEVARWQFAITTVYHFLFVPISIGLAWFVAVLQTRWHRTGDERWLRLTRLFGKLLLINFAIGVVTGIVQEFQFGMNWSTYSRYVGDIFGAPLAMEGLAAFFLESTFLGLWIFGWNRLKPGLHLATIWIVAFATTLSAYFILAANSWMQHPVGYRIDPESGRAQLTSIAAVLTNSTALYAFGHTIAAAIVTAGLIVIAVGAWHIRRGTDPTLFLPLLRGSFPVVLVAAIVALLIGHTQAQLLVEQQPMKMASAEALYETQGPAGFSLLAVGPFEHNPERSSFDVTVPHLLSVIATNTWSGEVRGINDLNAEYAATYGPGEYAPIVGLTYWTFRVMTGLGVVAILFAAAGSWLAWRNRLLTSRRFLWLSVAMAGLPFLANAAGWLFTELGRQPWVVQGLLKTEDAVSPTVGVWSVATTLIGFTLLYGVLAVIEVWLFLRYARQVPPAAPDDGATPAERHAAVSMAY